MVRMQFVAALTVIVNGWFIQRKATSMSASARISG